MGIPVEGPAWLLGDNQSVVTSSVRPTSVLTKRHNALAFHRVRSAIAASILYFCHVAGKENPADILTKALGYTAMWPYVQPFLFCRGETLPSGSS